MSNKVKAIVLATLISASALNPAIAAAEDTGDFTRIELKGDPDRVGAEVTHERTTDNGGKVKVGGGVSVDRDGKPSWEVYFEYRDTFGSEND